MLTAAVLLAGLASCTKSHTDNIIVSLRSCTTLTDRSVRICFEEVEDTRCPINALCIWAGQVVARFSIEKGQSKTYFTLTGNSSQHENVAFVAGYRVELLQVDPYPTGDANNENKTATLRVTNL